MITDPRNRQLVRRAIDALQLVADSYQAQTNYLAAHVTTLRHRDWPGRLLKTARTTDTLERILSELHGLADHPPGLGGPQQLRALPDPPGQLDCQPQPGLAVAAAGDSGSIAS